MDCSRRSSRTKPAAVAVHCWDGGAWPGGLLSSSAHPAGGGARWAQGNGLGKVSAALRMEPGRRVLGSSRGCEERGRRDLEPCRSLCWTRPRDCLPVPAALPRSRWSKRLPEPLAGAAAGPGETFPSRPPAAFDSRGVISISARGVCPWGAFPARDEGSCQALIYCRDGLQRALGDVLEDTGCHD